jgi:ribosomal protein L37AE/L43A
MGSKTKKIKAAGKFGAHTGVNVRHEYNAIESEQRKKQQSPYHPKGKAKRIAAGIWKDMKTGRIAGPAYVLNSKK